MRFLVDEDVYAVTTRRLRQLGHDVPSVAESNRRGTADPEIWEWARTDGRILVTRDKEFGRRFVGAPRQPPGLTLIRAPFDLIDAAHQALAHSLEAQPEEKLSVSLVVVEPARYRIRSFRPPE